VRKKRKKRKKRVGSAGRFGARYGVTVRKRVARIEAELRDRHVCERCKSGTVKRVSAGVWRCRKCDFTFAGGAYSPGTKLGEVAARDVRRLQGSGGEVSG